jgi:hypothetical protein
MHEFSPWNPFHVAHMQRYYALFIDEGIFIGHPQLGHDTVSIIVGENPLSLQSRHSVFLVSLVY